ncbi:MAG: glutaredoxin family protein [Cyanobacteriota bacterium]|nr:glutaredoxin family protein [Cyanobacteriota bacterium]
MAPTLLLFSRPGCCLCEGLEERLRALPAPPPLTVVNVDQDPALRARYDLTVPVLALESGEAGAWRELPRVPPRLSGERLAAWLRDHGVDAAAP